MKSSLAVFPPEIIAKIKFIYRLTAQAYGYLPQQLLDYGKHSTLPAARHVAMYVVRREVPQLSLPQLGALLNRDHTAIIHACQRVERISHLHVQAIHIQAQFELLYPLECANAQIQF